MEAARSATAADLPAVAGLVRRAVDELAPQRGGSVWAVREARAEPVEEGLEPFLDNPAAQLAVGTIDEQVVGYAAVHVEVLRDGTRLAVIDDLYVEPEARGVGVGESLMDHVVGWARGGGCTGLDAFVLPGNRESKNFFESFGLTARAILVHRSLEPDGRP